MHSKYGIFCREAKVQTAKRSQHNRLSRMMQATDDAALLSNPLGDDEEVLPEQATSSSENDSHQQSQPETSRSIGPMKSLEIELGAPVVDSPAVHENNDRSILSVPSADEDEIQDEAASLLGKQPKPSHNIKAADDNCTEDSNTAETTDADKYFSCRKCCRPDLRMGNIVVPNLYVYGYTGGWGAIGPHYMGPPCVMALVVFATHYFAIQWSWKRQWYGTFAVCMWLGLQTLYFLCSAAYRDPGVVREGRLNLPDPVPRSYRWCESCNYYQPPTTMHCPDCNACVAGFDHHCVWMGTCIGVGRCLDSFVAGSPRTPQSLSFCLFRQATLNLS